MKEKSQYKSLNDWRNANPKDYKIVQGNEWVEKICEIFGWEIKQSKPNGYWIKGRCISEANKYKTKTEWLKGDLGSYQAAHRNGWLDECTEHMIKRFVWTKERCIAEARKYKTKAEWLKADFGSYQASLKYNWHDECTKHMFDDCKPNGYWTKEKCIAEARKFKTRTVWQKNSGSSYNKSRINNWLDDCTKHMTRKHMK